MSITRSNFIIKHKLDWIKAVILFCCPQHNHCCLIAAVYLAFSELKLADLQVGQEPYFRKEQVCFYSSPKLYGWQNVLSSFFQLSTENTSQLTLSQRQAPAIMHLKPWMSSDWRLSLDFISVPEFHLQVIIQSCTPDWASILGTHWLLFWGKTMLRH